MVLHSCTLDACTTQLPPAQVSGRCASLGEDCFLITSDVNNDKLNDIALVGRSAWSHGEEVVSCPQAPPLYGRDRSHLSTRIRPRFLQCPLPFAFLHCNPFQVSSSYSPLSDFPTSPLPASHSPLPCSHSPHAQVYLDRVTETEEFYLTLVTTSPPAPLNWYMTSAAVFPRGACTSPQAVVRACMAAGLMFGIIDGATTLPNT